MISQVEQLNHLSLLEFPKYFSSLDAPQASALRGLFRGSFVGPAWLRALAGPLLVITRMGKWLGKDIDSEGRALNLVRTRGGIVQKFPMRLVERDSLIDIASPGWRCATTPAIPSHGLGLSMSCAASNPTWSWGWRSPGSVRW